MELRAGVWTEWVLLLVLERHFRQDVQRPVISVPDMKLNHLLEVKADVRETPTSAQTQTLDGFLHRSSIASCPGHNGDC